MAVLDVSDDFVAEPHAWPATFGGHDELAPAIGWIFDTADVAGLSRRT